MDRESQISTDDRNTPIALQGSQPQPTPVVHVEQGKDGEGFLFTVDLKREGEREIERKEDKSKRDREISLQSEAERLKSPDSWVPSPLRIEVDLVETGFGVRIGEDEDDQLETARLQEDTVFTVRLERQPIASFQHLLLLHIFIHRSTPSIHDGDPTREYVYNNQNGRRNNKQGPHCILNPTPLLPPFRFW
jgi:hypothetical protein